ncbi:hypothetical protein [Saccharothrix xinjiangensis]|uniref:Ribbon-helix-helix CopG family protein n=1 Tax=Saccharothrix xinjiangensis TaxID=204798 RepID=A0ABV9XTM3_9PSEU
MARPRTGETPSRNIRLDDALWKQVEDAAQEDQMTKTDVVKTALAEYLVRREGQRRAAQRRAEAEAKEQ